MLVKLFFNQLLNRLISELHTLEIQTKKSENILSWFEKTISPEYVSINQPNHRRRLHFLHLQRFFRTPNPKKPKNPILQNHRSPAKIPLLNLKTNLRQQHRSLIQSHLPKNQSTSHYKTNAKNKIFAWWNYFSYSS